MTAPLGVGVVGLGVGVQHARAYLALPEARLRWLYDLDPARSAAAATELGSARAAQSLEQILADPEVDLVSIASYDEAHFEQVIAALEAKKHVFCEKPLCRTLAEAIAIRKAAERAGRSVASNLVLRSAPLYRWLRDAVRGGELGSLFALDGDYLYGRLEKITDGWRSQTPDYSVMQGGGVHLVDLMLWITGERPLRVSAAGNRIASAGTAFRYHDFVTATFEFESGLIGRISANFGCVHRHHHVLRAFGTRASFLYDDAGPRLHTTRDPKASARPLDFAPLPASKGELIPAFVRSILHGEPSEGELDLAVVAACIAADRALSSGHKTNIEYP